MVMVTIAGFKNNGGSIEGEIFALWPYSLSGRPATEDPFYAFKASTDSDTMYLHGQRLMEER
jgi:hypothetical protein